MEDQKGHFVLTLFLYGASSIASTSKSSSAIFIVSILRRCFVGFSLKLQEIIYPNLFQDIFLFIFKYFLQFSQIISTFYVFSAIFMKCDFICEYFPANLLMLPCYCKNINVAGFISRSCLWIMVYVIISFTLKSFCIASSHSRRERILPAFFFKWP